MKKIIIALLVAVSALGSIYATDIDVEGRFGVGYGGVFSDETTSHVFTTTLGADAYCLNNDAVSVGFNAQGIFYAGNMEEFEINLSGSTTDSSRSLKGGSALYFGPVVKCKFTDAFSTRFSIGYLGASLATTVGLQFSADYAFTDKFSAGAQVLYGIPSYGADARLLAVNAMATYKF